MMRVKILTTIAVLGAFALSLSGCTKNLEQDVIRIGIPAPLSGGSAEYGEFIRKGASLAAQEVNAKGGINGRRVEVIFADSKGQPAEATTAAEKLIVRDHVQVITGAFNSSATLAVTEVARRQRVPMVVGLSTADSITAGGNPYVFRVCAPNRKLAQLLGDYIAGHNQPATIAYVYEKTDFGINLANVVRERLEAAGVRTVANEGVNQHESDFLALITKLKPLKPEMVFLAVIADSAFPFLRQAKQVGFHARWANAVSLSNPKFLEDAGELAAGFIGITHFEATQAQGRARVFVEAFESQYGQVPTHYSAVYYDTVGVIADAARDGTSRDHILARLQSENYEGITGRIHFDANRQASIDTVIFRWNGKEKQVLQVNPGN